ncbi:hypothetical protein [Marinobacter sp. Hex_13]|uniref:hypothetical protein n=1 Tax=Marinobacter sp. Hex_13 TaxID=1795866 RepID=UPI00079413FB|nr:hypothetical protein [Marinobacter sp. Hex_13]KXJ45900.1 MAG: hypothetical protein AXW11_12485 [Marinobacter sp. Hex_13]
MQYKAGTATVVSGSEAVSGTETQWLSNVQPGDSFVMAGVGLVYDVASVDSDTQLTLTAPYGGTGKTGAYAVQRDFTSDGIPEMAQGDIETAAIFTRAMRKLQGLLGQLGGVAGTGATIYPSIAAGKAGTSDTEYFWVSDSGTLKLYQNQTGTGVEQGEYPNSTTLQEAVDALAGYEERVLALIQSLHGDLGSLRLDFINQSYVVEGS